MTIQEKTTYIFFNPRIKQLRISENLSKWQRRRLESSSKLCGQIEEVSSYPRNSILTTKEMASSDSLLKPERHNRMEWLSIGTEHWWKKQGAWQLAMNSQHFYGLRELSCK
jgi:hypothetical protein